MPFVAKQILRAPRQPVQRPAILAGLDFAVGVGRLLQRELFGERHVEVQRRLIALQPREVHLRELGGRDELALDERGELRDRPERDVLEVGRAASASAAASCT